MKTISEKTVDRTPRIFGWPPQITGLKNVLVGLLFLALLQFPIEVFSATQPNSSDVSLGWTANSDPSIAGYAVYCGPAKGSYTQRIDTGLATNVTFAGQISGATNYFMVTAYNVAGVESLPSGEVSFIVPGLLAIDPVTRALSFPVAPAHSYEVQASLNLQTWQTIGNTGINTSNAWFTFNDPQPSAVKFYRLILH